jgi:hypothetical protein
MNKFSETLSKLAVWNKYSYSRFRPPSIRRPGVSLEMQRIAATRRELENQFRTTMLTMLGGAFAFVMALFWNDAIKETINAIVPANQTLFYKYLAAAIVTVIGVLAVFALTKVFKKAEP